MAEFEKQPYGETAPRSLNDDVVQDDENQVALDPKAIKKLRLKMDFIILPTVAVMYAFKYASSLHSTRCMDEH